MNYSLSHLFSTIFSLGKFYYNIIFDIFVYKNIDFY